MSDIVDIVSCLKKIETKNLGKNKVNLINYLIKIIVMVKNLQIRL